MIASDRVVLVLVVLVFGVSALIVDAFFGGRVANLNKRDFSQYRHCNIKQYTFSREVLFGKNVVDIEENVATVDSLVKNNSSKIPLVTECKEPHDCDGYKDRSISYDSRDVSFQIACSFEPRLFEPASKLLSNRHVQTISGALLRDYDDCRYIAVPSKISSFGLVDPGYNLLATALIRTLTKKQTQNSATPISATQRHNFWNHRERFYTPDHDFFDVDFKYVNGTVSSLSSKGTVIVVHGLQSNSNSSLVRELALVFVVRGLDVAAINFRGCTGTPNNNLKAYHLGFTDDLKQLITILSDRQRQQHSKEHLSTMPPLFLCGKSLGANVVLKALGELGDSAMTDYNIYAAAVCCCPFDNQRNANFLLRGFSKAVYNGNLVRNLKSRALQQLDIFQNTSDAKLVNVELLRKCTQITEFDEAFTAPLFGFDGHLDYYNQTSCLNYLDNIHVPTLILNSRDDPFFDPCYYPWDFNCHSVEGQRRKSPIRIVRSDYGGHLGFMFQKQEDEAASQVSFMPAELERFIHHVYECMKRVSMTQKILKKHSLEIPSSKRPRTESLRYHSFLLASSFRPREFLPPSFLANKHLQTISGVFLRNDPTCRFVDKDSFTVGTAIEIGSKLLSALSGEPDGFGSFWDHRQRIDTADGDFFHVDLKYHSDEWNGPASKGIVVIVHGLQSSSNSSLSVDLGRAFWNQGFDVACMNFRGCSGEPNESLRAYHLGFTDDLIQYLGMLNSNNVKPPPIFVSGFSLGANVVLKALGELGSSAFHDFNVYGAAVSGAPFDNERNIQFVQKAGFNKLAYNDSLLKSLQKSALRQIKRLYDTNEARIVSEEEISGAIRISDVESALIAPVFGFRDNVDYYRKTNCISFLDKIDIPTLILNAADDPFFDPSFFPWEMGCDSNKGAQTRSSVKMVRTEHGGHLGFMFHQKQDEEQEEFKSGQVEVSFMPYELSRFISRVYERRRYLERADIISQYSRINNQRYIDNKTRTSPR